MDATRDDAGTTNTLQTNGKPFDGGDTDRPITSGLARRLAAAADGYRNGHLIWFTARYEPVGGNYEISEAIESQARPAAPEDPEFGVFGPFKNDADAIKRTPVIGVTLHLEGGETRRFAADKYDAVIWSNSAIRKFALPHYAEYIGLEYAMAVRDGFLKNNVAAFVHGPNTEYRMVRTDDDGDNFLIVA
jgi:hypothetical protein